MGEIRRPALPAGVMASPATPTSTPAVAVYSLDQVPYAVALPERDINWDLAERQATSHTDTGHWSAGLFQCCDHCVPNGCMSFFCPCVSLAQILVRMGSERYCVSILLLASMWLAAVVSGVVFIGLPAPDEDDDYTIKQSLVCGPIVPVLFLWSGNALAILIIRKKIRFKFHIAATSCEDCAISCCCTPCAIAQAANHVASYTPHSCSFRPPRDLLPAFADDDR